MSGSEDVRAEGSALVGLWERVGAIKELVLLFVTTTLAPNASWGTAVNVDTLFEVRPQVADGDIRYDSHG